MLFLFLDLICFRPLSSELILTFHSHFAKWACNPEQMWGHQQTIWTILILITHGQLIFSGIVNVLLTTPLWVVNTRLKLQGATFRSKDLQDNKTKKYNGIIGKSSAILFTD